MNKFYWRAMNLSSWLLLGCLLGANASTYSQTITLTKKQVSLNEIVSEIQKQSQYRVILNKALIADNKKIDLSSSSLDVSKLLHVLSKEAKIQSKINGNNIFLYRDNTTTATAASKEEIRVLEQESIDVNGRVVDEAGKAVPGASIRVLQSKNGRVLGQTTSDADGRFLLKGMPKNLVLEISHISYKAGATVKVAPNVGDVVLTQTSTVMQEVVVSSGFVNRRAESFTGAATTFSQEQILQAGNQNILKSLKNLDPSFMVMENLSMGSNPNALPEIQMRGENSLPNLQGDVSSNPNQPLFILDGFETTLQRVFDLNMNRVASVTLLKDAAAKAIYGARAANGVVVIETVKPKAGELRLSYSADASLEVPDLTGYNLMNASEKLAFEKERGMYSNYVSGAAGLQHVQGIYKQNYDNVTRGVDTYWLSQPLRTGLSSKHNLTLEGGDARMRYQAGVTFADNAGVMKGSGRQTFGINNTLSYTYKNLIFRNSLEYNRNTANNSPYGSFSDYVNLNPYYSPTDDKGQVLKELGLDRNGPVYNPLYNATLNTKNQSAYTEVVNNFNMDWNISPSIRAVGSLAYSRNEQTSDLFYPASHTIFAGYTDEQSSRKGRYTKGAGLSQFINSNIGVNYNKQLGQHLLFANATWNLTSRNSSLNSYTAEGFGNDNMDNIGFGSMYQFNGKPTGSDSRVREIGVVGLLNYSYADRYLFDASLRTSGSSMYGADSRWGAFWSLGAGWNLHRESFMQQQNWLKQFKLRGSMGYTGSQNFDPYQSRARYLYGDIVYNGGLGAELQGLPNPNLKWQRTMDYNLGTDFNIADFFTGRFDYYIQNTKDLLTDMTVVPSMGFDSYKENMGETQNKGYEFNIGITPWRDRTKQAWFTVTIGGIHRENKLRKIYDTFDSWNESQDGNLNLEITQDNYNNLQLLQNAYTKPKTYFYEGQSMNAIWGVRSLGIDPMTGNEMYLDKNGNSTWVWSTADQKVIGNTTPKLQGNIGFNAGYRGFTLAMTCGYRFGGDLYNTTLIERIENITGYNNLDRRVLDSWRAVGDLAPYRAVNISAGTTSTYTQPTSRFVQCNNELYISSLNMGYTFTNKAWMERVRLNNLRCSFYMNELLRISSITVERGTSYPFARSLSFMVQASF